MFSNKTMGYASFVMSDQLIPTTVIVPVIEFIKVLERVFLFGKPEKTNVFNLFLSPHEELSPSQCGCWYKSSLILHHCGPSCLEGRFLGY